jgi:hypothetical protein
MSSAGFRELLQRFTSPAQLVLKIRETRHVGARMSKARDETLADRIGDPYKYDGSGARLPPQGSHRERTTCQDDLRWWAH